MKSEYYKIIQVNELADILSEITIISYSFKQKILESLLELYSVQTINLALYEYKKNYIDLNRVNVIKLKNTLIYFCKILIFFKKIVYFFLLFIILLL